MEGLPFSPPGIDPLGNRKRSVFRQWPRNPKGPILQKEDSCRGKETSNGIQLWGATLYDFYWVCRVPTALGYRTVSSSSKLAAWVEKQGEEERRWALDELAWAKDEDDPVQLYPHGLFEAIQAHEMDRDAILEFSLNKNSKTQSISYPISPFDFDKYPHPWPLVPFTSNLTPLQKQIPFPLLPRKLIVHDPWDILQVKQDRIRDAERESWEAKTDILRTYKLRVKDEPDKSEKKDIQLGEIKSYVLWPKIDEENGPSLAPLLVHPQYQPLSSSKLSEAHLYLSPYHLSGKGNHSVVYKAEWELPRSTAIGATICSICVWESIECELREGTPEYETVSLTGESIIPNSSDSTTFSREWKVGKGTLTLAREHLPEVLMETFFSGWNCDGKSEEKDAERKKYMVKPARTVMRYTYRGPARRVYPKIQRQNPDVSEYCSHILNPEGFKHIPPTVKVAVIAKLSLPGDSHLDHEARNYEKFPAHFFEYWNGFNIVPPSYDPVPINAVVPQFYGYYQPEDEDKDEDEDKTPLSPILLIEHCGEQVSINGLDPDQRQECASLIYRFHNEGWQHNSVYGRNFVVQASPLTQPVSNRSALSFRLIDFGRSCHAGSGDSMGGPGWKFEEQTRVQQLFDL